MAKGRRGTGEPYLRGSTYWIKYYVDGKAVYESTGTSNKSDAVKILNRKRAEADRGQLTANRCTIEDLLSLLLRQQRRLQRADIAHVESRIKNHLNPALGRILVNRFAQADVERYIDERLDSEAAPATINRELACLKTALNIGLERNLLHRVIKWTKLPELNIRAGFLDHDDYRRLLSELIDELKLLLVFGYHYGIRKSELLGYRWDYVDWFAKELRIPQPNAKNKEPKIIPFYGEVEQWLGVEKARHDAYYSDSPWIFSRAGKVIKDFRESWSQAVQRAELQDSLGWFHDLRRSAVRNMTNAGLDQKMAMAISGHTTDSVFRRYRIVPRKDLRRAADRMNEFFRQEEAALDEVVTKPVTATPKKQPQMARSKAVN
jgi:integrase